MTARTAVVHLVREANGLAPFEAFMDSYERHPAGEDHDLILLFKGFGTDSSRAPYIDRAGGCSRLDVGDEGFDLTAYRLAARRLTQSRLCFLNSFSEIQSGGWLGILSRALDPSDVGAAGATGSWASNASLVARQVGFRGPYAKVFPRRRELGLAMHSLSGTNPRGEVAEWLFSVKMAVRNLRSFPRFPAAHLRTNAFLIERATFLALAMDDLGTKRDAHRFEGGRNGMTPQLVARGTPPVVVDRHGVARKSPEWAAGDVFWQADQAGLLVADNQTKAYAAASIEHRALLSRFAWGPSARPV